MDGKNITAWGVRLQITALLSIIVVAAMGCVMAMTPKEWETYLQRTEGPYRGRVVDSETKEPISGAVVAAVWYHDVYALVQTNMEFYDAVEVLTDDQGFFVVNAQEIEQRAPARTSFPVFTIFKRGYRYFKGRFASTKEMAERQSKSLLGVVELEPYSGRVGIAPLPPSALVPRTKVPRLVRAVEEANAQKQSQ